MSDKPDPRMSAAQMMLHDMPRWARTAVFVIVSPFLALAIIGGLMGLNFGSYIDRSLEAQFEKQRQVQESVAARIIQEYSEQAFDLNTRLIAIEDQLSGMNSLEDRVETMEEWACRVSPDEPPWCKKLEGQP